MSLGYPLVVIDDFLEEPDEILNIANNTEFFDGEVGNYPGQRSKPLQEIDERLFQYIGRKIFTIFQNHEPDFWELRITFQKVKSFSPDDQYDPVNLGWIHTDNKPWFGGVIYLDPKPEPDTGTSIYRLKRGYTFHYQHELKTKEALYRGEEVDLDKYNEYHRITNDQYEETIKVHNVYNRLVLFDGCAHHGAQTYGTKERLTLNFFGLEQKGEKPPLLRGER
tara:strand:- start:70 stop:735 length:666 start_codon:yes stop_codon:yes gene_type:complete